jgi:hypothetical protein
MVLCDAGSSMHVKHIMFISLCLSYFIDKSPRGDEYTKKMKLSLVITALLLVRVTGKDVGGGDRNHRRSISTSNDASSNYNIKGAKKRKLATTEQSDGPNAENKVLPLPSSELAADQVIFSDTPSDLPSTQPSSLGVEIEADGLRTRLRNRGEVSTQGDWDGHILHHKKSSSSKDHSDDVVFIPIPIPIPLYIPNGNRTDIDDVFCPLGVNLQSQCCLTWDPENCRCPFGTPMDGMDICCEPLAGDCGCEYGIGTDGRCCLPSEECYCPLGENQQGECCETWDPEMCRCPFGVPPDEGAEECCEADDEGCTYTPTYFPTVTPSPTISMQPTDAPSPLPSAHPSRYPSLLPSTMPSGMPSATPSKRPSAVPSSDPSGMPSGSPSSEPSDSPSDTPSSQPSLSILPSASPSETPSLSSSPSHQPSELPSVSPSTTPSDTPSDEPSTTPSGTPSSQPSLSILPSASPSETPSFSSSPSHRPSEQPSMSQLPSLRPSEQPSQLPSDSAAPNPRPVPIPEICEEAMVYCGTNATNNPDTMAWCHENELPGRWGFTNRVGTNTTCIIGVIKSRCDVTNGYNAGTVEIDQENKKFTVNLNPGVLISEYHVRNIPQILSNALNFLQ